MERMRKIKNWNRLMRRAENNVLFLKVNSPAYCKQTSDCMLLKWWNCAINNSFQFPSPLKLENCKTISISLRSRSSLICRCCCYTERRLADKIYYLDQITVLWPTDMIYFELNVLFEVKLEGRLLILPSSLISLSWIVKVGSSSSSSSPPKLESISLSSSICE